MEDGPKMNISIKFCCWSLVIIDLLCGLDLVCDLSVCSTLTKLNKGTQTEAGYHVTALSLLQIPLNHGALC